MALDTKDKIQQAIKSFAQGKLFDNAIQLFNALGYSTTRQSRLTKNSYKGFIDDFPGAVQKMNPKKTWSDTWQSVELLFQLTQSEMSTQSSLFDKGKVDNTIMEAYLFFAIELNEGEYTRTQLSDITREVNKVFSMPVMILFIKGSLLTLSVINRRLHKRDTSKDVLEKVTLIKDISIVSPHRAHIEILHDLSFDVLKDNHPFTNFVELHQAWQKTLDTKELNKRFFNELATWYFWAMDKVQFPDDLEKKKDVRNATNLIRLLTRVIFIWFIKEKSLIPNSLFNRAYLPTILKDFNKNKKAQNYYNAVLQNLFFGTLNQKMDERKFAKEGDIKINREEYGVKNLFRHADLFTISEKEIMALFKDVPFLNGGLFDCLDKPNEENQIVYVDGFSRNPRKQAAVPDYLFFGEESEVDLNEIYGTSNKKYKTKGLVNILESYKFTVAENTPIEEEIALDPELLGKVFENLLASYNPETQTTARKQTGSFYTPREIVNYMVDESLIEYLKNSLTSQQAGIVELGKKQVQLFGNESKKGQMGLETKIAASKWNDRIDELDDKLRQLFSYQTVQPFTDAGDVVQLIDALNKANILDPACGSGAYPMGVLHKMVHVLQKLDPDNKHWRALQEKKAIDETKEAYKIGDKESRARLLGEINDVFENNASDYGRKLYLIENCIYGIDIQPIAVQIAKLRFFISLIIDQNKQVAKENLGIRSLPNLETKFVAANTLIGLDKPTQTLLRNPKIEERENELKELRHKYFTANTRKEKLQYQNQDKKLRQEIARMLESDGWQTKVARQIVAFDPYDQNQHADWFDPEWMFGLTKGFDIVIGNPPYGAKFSEEEKLYFKRTFKHQDYQPESYLFFIEKSFELIKNKAVVSFIIPNTWLTNLKLVKIRKFLTSNNTIQNISHYHKSVFDAVVDTEVVIFKKGFESNNFVKIYNHISPDEVQDLKHNQNSWKAKDGDVINIFTNPRIEKLIEKLKTDSEVLSVFCDLYSGVKPYEIGKGSPPQTKEILKNRIYDSTSKKNNSYKKVLRGSDIGKYQNNWDGERWIKYGDNLAAPRKPLIFSQPKIVIRQTGDSLIATYDNEGFICLNNTHVINQKLNTDLKFTLALINSSLLNFYFQYLNPESGEALAEVKKKQLKNF